MSLIQRVRDSFARPLNSGYQTYTFRIDQQVACHLVPMIERMADGDNDAWTLVNAVRFYFVDQRPIIALHRGGEGRAYIEGPLYNVGGEQFPLGAQVALDCAGWVNLDPVEARDLDCTIRKAVDNALYRWLAEHDLAGRGTLCRQPRNRELEDHTALCQMAAAAGRFEPESEANNG